MENQYRPDRIHTYNRNTEINSVSQLPVPAQERSPTDVFCTVVTAAFALAMLVTACVVFNGDKLGFITFPTDAQARKCTQDTPGFNYLYFTSPKDITKRLCVAECPRGSENRLKCIPTEQLSCARNSNPDFEVQIYATVLEETSVGLYCFPQDQQLRQSVIQQSNLQDKFEFVRAYRSIWISVGVAFGLGLLFVTVTCCATGVMVYASILLGGLSFLAMSVLLLVQNSRQFRSYSPALFLLAIIFIVFAVMLLASLFLKRKDLKLCQEYLSRGVSVLGKQKALTALVPAFMALTVGLVALCWFQLLAFWSHSELAFRPSELYYTPEGTFASVMQFLVLIEFLWGLCFLKEAYNFIISGCAVTNEFLKDSFIMFGIKGLLRFHWGSVVASSFLLNFFFLPDLIYDFIRPSESNGGCHRCFASVCCCCDRLFGFARSETMAFINAVGLPYCNSSRWCERINFKISYFDGSQSVFRYFSLGSHALLALSATAIGFLYSTASGSSPHQLVLLFSFALNLFVVTYFVSLIKNLAEASFMSVLIQKYIQGEDMVDELEHSYAQDSSLNRGGRQTKLDESHVSQGYQILPTQQ